MDEPERLAYLEWLALANLYKHRDRKSSPVRYVGLEATIAGLINHRPPLAEWIGKSSENQVHITAEGILRYEFEATKT
jgi:hypothetical protein